MNDNMTFNNQMKLPGTYFANMAKRDYRNWSEAIIRELTQNSVDAGAGLLDIRWDLETRTLSFRDNGSGMTRDILENAFLQFGASHKAEGSVGGMGKAKELIIASWPFWEIKTNGILATGRHNEYNVSECAFEKGTTITLQITSDMHMDDETIRRFFGKCQINGCVMLNGELITDSTWAKAKVAELEGFGNLYKGSQPDSVCYVRANGVFMFSEWTEGQQAFIFEISNSAGCMSAGRDGFVGDYYSKFSKLVREMNFNASGFKEYKAEIDFMVSDNEEETMEKENIFKKSWESAGITEDVHTNFVGAMDQAIQSAHDILGSVDSIKSLRPRLEYIPKVQMNITNMTQEQRYSDRGAEIIKAIQKRAKLSEADAFAGRTALYSKFLKGRFLLRTTDLSKESQKYMTTVKAAQINFLFFGVVKEVAKIMKNHISSPKNFVVGGFVDKDSTDEALCSDNKILLNLGMISKYNFDEALLAKLIGLACHEVCHFQETHNERMAAYLTDYLPLMFTEYYPKFKTIFKKVKEMKPIFKVEVDAAKYSWG